MDIKQLVCLAIDAAIKASVQIVEVYNSSNFEIESKSDSSPLTLADKRAHLVINKTLNESGIPVLSEEGADFDYQTRKMWNVLWIVDPLDGTKEFINRNGEFTVNIALVENSIPIAGVILVPVTGRCYFGAVGIGAFRIDNIVAAKSFEQYVSQAKILPFDADERNEVVVVASRSHRSAETEDFIQEISNKSNVQIVNIGSALKMGLIAEGTADIYPRFAPTMEWDVAAGHAIIVASGGCIISHASKKSLTYNKENLQNDWFVCKRKDFIN